MIFITTLLFVRNVISLLFVNKSPSAINKKGDDITRKKSFKKTDIMLYSIILERNPFGAPMKFFPLIVKQDIETGDSRSVSDLILVGTAVGPEEMSYAVFESKSKGTPGQEVFTLGDKVFDYGVLTVVEPGYVRIKQGNDIITIAMVDIDTLTKRPRLKNGRVHQNSFVKKIGERYYLLNREKVQEALENPQQILTDARLLPNFRNGKQVGFKVYEVRPGGLYESLGLKNGDILLRINGLDISSPEVAIQAMSALRGMNRINLDIMRNGAKLSLNYQIR